MLVLTRKVDEKIVIGNNHEIIAKILQVKGGKVRIGIEAPKNIKIQREEILRRLEQKDPSANTEQPETGIEG